MVVNKNSWHYKVYDFSYALSLKNQPRDRTNLCQYMRRLLFVAPIIGFLCAFMFCFAAVMVLCFYLFGPIFGWVPKQWLKPWIVFDDKAVYKYEGLRIGRSYNAFQLYPWHVILAVLVVGLEWVVYHVWGFHPLAVQGEIVGAVALFVGLIFAVVEFSYSDTGTVGLVKEYVSAKKQKVCPVVEFTDKE